LTMPVGSDSPKGSSFRGRPALTTLIGRDAARGISPPFLSGVCFIKIIEAAGKEGARLEENM